MSVMYFYADAESVDVLQSGKPKALLIGSDFGYGNFGDVLQHVGTISRLREASSLALVSIFTLEAISRFVSVEALRREYRLDALMFISFEPLSSEDCQRLSLQQVVCLSAVSVIHLYGGGFLNKLWGNFSLQLVEFFVRRLPGARYVISGQQVSSDYALRVSKHIHEFKPQLVGVRDRDSLRSIQELGLSTDFSFDDAVEPLLALSSSFHLKRGSGAFLHLNSSGYTGNETSLEQMVGHLRMISQRIGGNTTPVLFQAFQDGREEVVDAMETVKRLERAFPFSMVESALLIEAIMAPVKGLAPRVLVGDFGYSCSYHITMWLQLNGIPCWLRGSNDYYDQKRRSLGVEGDFDSFLESLPTVDHSDNLESRRLWSNKLNSLIGEADPVSNRIDWESVAAHGRKFRFKGEPRLEARLDESWRITCALQEERQKLLSDAAGMQEDIASHEGLYQQLVEKTEQLRRELLVSKTENESLKAGMLVAQEKCVEVQLQFNSLSAANEIALKNQAQLFDESRTDDERIASSDFVRGYVQERLAVLQSRIDAYNDQLSLVGHDARRFRAQAEAEYLAKVELAAREQASNAQLQQMLSSRSWRWTRSLRAFKRFASTRRFDVDGHVGIYEALRIVGSKTPLPQCLKSRLGRMLRGMRRR